MLERVKESVPTCRTGESEPKSKVFDHLPQSTNRVSSNKNDDNTTLMALARGNPDAPFRTSHHPAKLCERELESTPLFNLTKGSGLHQKAACSLRDNHSGSSQATSQTDCRTLGTSRSVTSQQRSRLMAPTDVPSCATVVQKHVSEAGTSHGISLPTTSPERLSKGMSLAAMASQHLSGLPASTETTLVTMATQPRSDSLSSIGSSTTGMSQATLTTPACGRSLLATTHFSGSLVSSGVNVAASPEMAESQRDSGMCASTTPSLAMLATQHHSGSVTSVSQLTNLENTSSTKLAARHILGPVNSAATSQPASLAVTSAAPSLAMLATLHRSGSTTSSSETISQPPCSDHPNIASSHISAAPSSVGSSLATMASKHFLTHSGSAASESGPETSPHLSHLEGIISKPVDVGLMHCGSYVGPVDSTKAVSASTLEETRKVETRKVETRKVETRKVETRKVETRKVETRKVETRKVETRKVETRKVETRKVETRKVETRKVETRKVETRKVKPPPGFHMLSTGCGPTSPDAPSSRLIARPPPGFRNRSQTINLKQLLKDSLPCDVSPGCTREHRRRTPAQMFAEPSLFGATLCTSDRPRDVVQKQKCDLQFRKFVCGCPKSPDCEDLDVISRFNFVTPSPDDIVKEKQKAAFGNPGERE